MYNDAFERALVAANFPIESALKLAQGEALLSNMRTPEQEFGLEYMKKILTGKTPEEIQAEHANEMAKLQEEYRLKMNLERAKAKGEAEAKAENKPDPIQEIIKTGMYTPESIKAYKDGLAEGKPDPSVLKFSEKIDKDPARLTQDQVDHINMLAVERLKDSSIRDTTGKANKSSFWKGSETDAIKTWQKLTSLSPEELDAIEGLDPMVKRSAKLISEYTRALESEVPGNTEDAELQKYLNAPPVVEYAPKKNELSVKEIRTFLKELNLDDSKQELEKEIIETLGNGKVGISKNNIVEFLKAKQSKGKL